MTVPLTGTGGFFTRQGQIIGEYNRVAGFYGSGFTSFLNTIWAQFASSDQQAIANLPAAIAQIQQTGQPYLGTLQGDGVQAALLQVSDDTSVVPYTQARATQILHNQMVTAGASVQRPTLGNTVTAGSGNLGNSVVVAGTTNIYGDPLDMTLTETFNVTCTQQNGFGGNLSFVGQAARQPGDALWPGGSGASATCQITDPAAAGMTTDGGFANWTGTGANTPVSWIIVNGAAGVTVFKGVSNGLRSGTNSAKILSDGASATQLGQVQSVQINTMYAVCVVVKINSLDASGTFRIALTDQDGNVINNDAGTALSYSRNVNGQVTTSYQMFTAFFTTPRQLPDSVLIQAGFSAAPTSGRYINVDLVGMVPAVALYGAIGTGTQGPWVAAFAQDEASAADDTWTCAFINSLTSKSFVLGSQRLYDLRSQGVYYPSALSPTISDSLVTN